MYYALKYSKTKNSKSIVSRETRNKTYTQQ